MASVCAFQVEEKGLGFTVRRAYFGFQEERCHRGRFTTVRHTHPHCHFLNVPFSIIHNYIDKQKHLGDFEMSKTHLAQPLLFCFLSTLNLWAIVEGFAEAESLSF